MLEAQINALDALGVPVARYLLAARPQIGGAELARAINTYIWENELFGEAYSPEATLGKTDRFIDAFNALGRNGYYLPKHPEEVRYVRGMDGYYRTRGYKWGGFEGEGLMLMQWPTSLSLFETVDTHELLFIILSADISPESETLVAALLLALDKSPAIISEFDMHSQEEAFFRVASGDIYIILSTSRLLTPRVIITISHKSSLSSR